MRKIAEHDLLDLVTNIHFKCQVLPPSPLYLKQVTEGALPVESVERARLLLESIPEGGTSTTYGRIGPEDIRTLAAFQALRVAGPSPLAAPAISNLIIDRLGSEAWVRMIRHRVTRDPVFWANRPPITTKNLDGYKEPSMLRLWTMSESSRLVALVDRATAAGARLDADEMRDAPGLARSTESPLYACAGA